MGRPRVSERDKEVAKRYRKGQTHREIADALGVNRSTVTKIVARLIDSQIVKLTPRARGIETDMPARPMKGLSLYELMGKLTPAYDTPRHLEPLPQLLENAPRGALRVVVGIPVRHGKSETVHHGIVKMILDDPTLEIVYATYGARFSFKQARKIRMLAQRAGVKFKADFNTIEHWQTPEGGGVLSTSVDGPLTGMGADVLVIDDPYKNRAHAESQEHRDKVWEWFTSVAMTRLSPTASVLVVMSRWHEDDLSGRLIKDGWTYVHKRAIETDPVTGEERALWPERRPLEWLHQHRKRDAYDWASLFQNEPRPKDGALFKQPIRCSSVPTNGIRVAFGIDVSYSNNPRSDYFAIAKLVECGGQVYVADVARMRADLQIAESVIKSFTSTAPGAPVLFYASGKDHGVVRYLAGRGIAIQAMQAKTTKFVRSQKLLAAWNGVQDELGRVVEAQRVQVPLEASWVDVYLSEFLRFTGSENTKDDQVDATVAAFDFLQSAPVAAPRMMGTRRM